MILVCIPERDDHAPTGFENNGDPCQCGAKRIVQDPWDTVTWENANDDE
jgi:hypothetical protein